MSFYTYKVVPAPSKAPKVAGVKAPEARFALGLEEAINEMAAEGWEYLRADILPSEERQGLTSTQTVYRSVLIFRRTAAAGAAAPEADSAAETPPPPAAPPVHRPEAPRAAPRLGAAMAKMGESLRRGPPLTARTPPQDDAPEPEAEEARDWQPQADPAPDTHSDHDAAHPETDTGTRTGTDTGTDTETDPDTPRRDS